MIKKPLDLYNTSFRMRLTIAFTVIFSIILIVLSLITSTYTTQKYEDLSYRYCNKMVEGNILLLDRYLSQVQTLSNIIAKDSDILEAVRYRNNHLQVDYSVELFNQRKVATKLKQLDSQTIASNALIIGANNKPIYYYIKSPVPDYDFGKQSWFFSTYRSTDFQIRFTDEHTTDYLIHPLHKKTVSIITPITQGDYKMENLAYLMCDLNMDMLFSQSKGTTQIETGIIHGDQTLYFPQGTGFTE